LHQPHDTPPRSSNNEGIEGIRHLAQLFRDMGAESDFTSAIQPIEQAAGVVVGGTSARAAE